VYAAIKANPRGLDNIKISSKGQGDGVRVKYQTLEVGRFDIHLCTLRDKQQFSDPHGAADALGISSATWSMFGVVWDSSRVLANFMLDFEVRGKRILEVGCGVGLTSLMLKQRKLDITATDHHPEAREQLNKNSLLNNDEKIPFVRSSWKDEHNGLGKFDVIIGSDLLYDRFHLKTLASFLERHAKPHAQIILVDPGRGECARFSKLLVAQGFNDLPYLQPEAEYLDTPFKGRILRYER
jgi:ETFB lysine methyltransferase